MKIPTPSDDELFNGFVSAVEFSINTHGYKWTFFKNQGGWSAVLKKYPKVRSSLVRVCGTLCVQTQCQTKYRSKAIFDIFL